MRWELRISTRKTFVSIPSLISANDYRNTKIDISLNIITKLADFRFKALIRNRLNQVLKRLNIKTVKHILRIAGQKNNLHITIREGAYKTLKDGFHRKESSLITKNPGGYNTRALYFAMGYGATDSGDMNTYTGFDKQVDLGSKLLMDDWWASSGNETMSVNNGKNTVRNGVTYPGSIQVDTYGAYALYRYTPWTFDTSLSTISGGNYLFLQVFETWWTSWKS